MALDLLDLVAVSIAKNGEIIFLAKDGENWNDVTLDLHPELELPQNVDALIERYPRGMMITKDSIKKFTEEMIVNCPEADIASEMKRSILSLKKIVKRERKFSCRIFV